MAVADVITLQWSSKALRSRRHWVLVDPGTGATSTTGSSKRLGSNSSETPGLDVANDAVAVEWLWMNNLLKSKASHPATGNVHECKSLMFFFCVTVSVNRA